METYPYNYNAQVLWRFQQNQYCGKALLVAEPDQQQPLQRAERIPGNEDLQAEVMAWMPKERVQALAQALRRWFVVASLMGFSGLAAVHQVEAEANQATQPSDSSQSVSLPSSLFEQNNFDHNDFFKQQGGDNFGSRNTASAPITGSGVS